MPKNPYSGWDIPKAKGLSLKTELKEFTHVKETPKDPLDLTVSVKEKYDVTVYKD